MFLNWPILSVASNPRFWSDYFWKTYVSDSSDGYTSLVNCVHPVSEADLKECAVHHITPPKSHQYCRLDLSEADVTLRLEFDPGLNYISLQLVDQTGKSTEIAWDNEAHWHPHVLRWEELKLICKYVESLDERLCHPGIPLLLLCRFAPVTKWDDLEGIRGLLQQAWQRVGTSTDEQTQVFTPSDHLIGIEWRKDEQAGWYLHVDYDERFEAGLYTLRSLDNPDFPFETLRVFLEGINRQLHQ